MAFEDKTITCVQCGEGFAFTAGEQAFFAERGLESEPKRCKSCRRKKKKKSRYADRENDGIYRSPAFESSAPRHQKIRRRHNGRGAEGGDEQQGRRNLHQGHHHRHGDGAIGEYRSPAFKEHDKIRPEEEYRAPGFQEYKNIDPTDEYRSPGFREYNDIDISQEYRAPAYGGQRGKHRDERPLFHIVCPACGKEAMVPVVPEEREDVLCKECSRGKRRREYEERSAAEAAEVKPSAAEEREENPPAVETEREDDAL